VFEGNTVVEVCSHHLHTPPESPSVRLGETLPPDLEAVILNCLAKDPANRYPDADALAHAFDACESVDEWSADLAAEWWKMHKLEADEARPKISRPSRLPGPVAIDLAGRNDTHSRSRTR
jgi:serine/threonine-protein kinase